MKRSAPMLPLTRFLRDRFRESADPEDAKNMQAYMKTEVPFYGVRSKARSLAIKDGLKKFPVLDRTGYEAAILDLWKQKHREEKYAAIAVAVSSKKYIDASLLPLFEKLTVEGAWWDYVDWIAAHLVGEALQNEPGKVWPVMDAWIDHEDMWLRRTAILCQLRHKTDTDEKRLFSYCKKRMHEKEFFIRKAIGWALRQYSYSAPKAVKTFLLANEKELSGLSFREGAKGLKREGLL
jgi:3-methyladenine DNA glycosylase AlkD